MKAQRRGAKFGGGRGISDAWLIHEIVTDAPMIEGRYYTDSEIRRTMARRYDAAGDKAAWWYHRQADLLEETAIDQEAREERNMRREIHRLRPRKRYSRGELRRQYG